MRQTRRTFLKTSTSVAAFFAVPPALIAEGLESIKAAFGKAQQLSAEDAAKNESLWKEVTKAFDNLNPEYINLGTIGRGISARTVTEAVIDTYRRCNDYRIGGNYVPEKKEAVRKQLAAYVNCAPEELALTRNTTDGVTTVLSGFNLEPGDEILTTTQEHLPFYGFLDRREKRDGVVVRKVRLPLPAASPDELAGAMEKAITPRTRLIMVCHIYLTGQIFPVRRLADFARARGVKILVDGALSFGQMKTDIKQVNCDFYAASLHKCGGGPMGTGLFYVRPDHIATLPPLYGYFDDATKRPLSESGEIKKYEHMGTQSEAMMLSIGQMLDLHQAIGIERIQERLHYLKQYWAEQVIPETNVRFAASFDPRLSCAALGFDIKGKTWADVAVPLREQDKIRLSGCFVDGEYGKPETWRELIVANPAIFTTLPQLDRFVTAIKRAAHE